MDDSLSTVNIEWTDNPYPPTGTPLGTEIHYSTDNLVYSEFFMPIVTLKPGTTDTWQYSHDVSIYTGTKIYIKLTLVMDTGDEYSTEGLECLIRESPCRPHSLTPIRLQPDGNTQSVLLISTDKDTYELGCIADARMTVTAGVTGVGKLEYDEATYILAVTTGVVAEEFTLTLSYGNEKSGSMELRISIWESVTRAANAEFDDMTQAETVYEMADTTCSATYLKVLFCLGTDSPINNGLKYLKYI